MRVHPIFFGVRRICVFAFRRSSLFGGGNALPRPSIGALVPLGTRRHWGRKVDPDQPLLRSKRAELAGQRRIQRAFNPSPRAVLSLRHGSLPSSVRLVCLADCSPENPGQFKWMERINEQLNTKLVAQVIVSLLSLPFPLSHAEALLSADAESSIGK